MRKSKLARMVALGVVALVCAAANAQSAGDVAPAPAAAPAPSAPPVPPAPSAYDAELAKRVGANENGMRAYVFVLLKAGPTKVPAGPERDEMFKGHFANMKRLASEGKLVMAGPFDGVEGWQGLFIFATTDIEEAKKYVATDPVIIKGEMVAEYHKHYGSAALMLVNEQHYKVARKPF